MDLDAELPQAPIIGQVNLNVVYRGAVSVPSNSLIKVAFASAPPLIRNKYQ